jgi:hypothetical protein
MLNEAKLPSESDRVAHPLGHRRSPLRNLTGFFAALKMPGFGEKEFENQT